MTINERIQDELQALGVIKCYQGYRLAALALSLVLEDENRLLNLSQEVYPLVAKLCGCKASNVERNIRTVSRIAWERNPSRLQTIARYPLSGPPSSLEFITILLSHIQRNPYSTEPRKQL